MSKQLAPVVLFAYCRLDHLAQTVTSLLRNPEAHESDVIVFSDGARNRADEPSVAAVRTFLGQLRGFRSHRIIQRETNLGLARNIVGGVTQALTAHERVIVVEDDLQLSPYFLQYINDGLNYYKNNPRVASIHGYVYPIEAPLPETFFLRGADCWGWATWRDRWGWFNPDGSWLLRELRAQKLESQFDFQGAHDYMAMLENQVAGHNDSWAIRWHASCFLREALTLYPGRSLVHNIGFDGAGSTHAHSSKDFDVALSSTPVRVMNIPVEDNILARKAFGEFLKGHRKGANIFHKLLGWLGRHQGRQQN